jgi:hypothetical protein
VIARGEKGRGPILLAALVMWSWGVTGSCGYVGDPFPPALDIPSTVIDFRAWESGPNIEMEFTLPKLTTEGLPLKSVRSIELSVAESPAPASAPSATHYQVPATVPGVVTHQIPVREWVGKTLTLAVRATGPKGKASAWSNPSVLTVIQPLAKPGAPKVDNVAAGVALTWTGAGPHYRVFRAEGDGAPALLAQAEGPTYMDTTTSYGNRYRYLVQAIAEPNQWSEVSDAYNVYRSVDGAAPVKIAELVETPAFSDTKVEAGKRYKYTVSAVDSTGNESAQSIAAETTL